MPKKFEYKTKCRICECIYVREMDINTYNPTPSRLRAEFVVYIGIYLHTPRQYECNSCETPTIQDVVSYEQ